MHHILSRDDPADSRVMGCFYLAVIQAQLFCGSETWVISQHALK